MEMHVERAGGWTVIRLDGDLDAASAPDMQGGFVGWLNDAASFYLVDLGRVQHLDSAGLAALVKFYREVRVRGGRLALCGVQREPMRVFQLTRLDKLFSIYPTPEAARVA